MPNFYLKCVISLFLLSVPVSSYATFSIKDADVMITLRNGHPCFSYPRDKEIQKGTYSFSYLSVSKNGPKGGTGWEIGISNPDRKGLLDPNSPEKCIEYGVLSAGLKEKQTAEALVPDTPYSVFMRVAEVSGRSADSRKFLSDFCVSHNEKGEQVIVTAEGDGKTGAWRCLKPGEAVKRGFFQKLFGN